MNKIVIKDNIKIENLIYEVRGKQVMLDSDLAMVYECKNGTKEINQIVKRNIDRFPIQFCFQLTNDEYDYLRSQIVTSSSKESYGGRRYLLFVFTEQGVAMLSALIKSDIAIKRSIYIMNAFVAMRKFISTNLLEQRYINTLVEEKQTKYILLVKYMMHILRLKIYLMKQRKILLS